MLEIGARHASDLSGYCQVAHLALVGASESLRRRENSLLPQIPAVECVDADPELPFPAASFDVVVCTFFLCRSADPVRLVREVCRTLRSAGHLLFLEHSRNPATRTGADGGSSRCRSDLDVPRLLARSGLVLHRIELTWPDTTSLLRDPVVQGAASHPAPQYEREFRWLSGA